MLFRWFRRKKFQSVAMAANNYERGTRELLGNDVKTGIDDGSLPTIMLDAPATTIGPDLWGTREMPTIVLPVEE